MTWPVVYYRKRDGSEPVDEFISNLDATTQVVLDNQIERLGVFGSVLPFPHSSQLRGELRELRCHHGNDLYRILYRRSDNLFVLLHTLRKREEKVPDADIELAQERWNDFKERMNERPRRPPRAAGHDAG